MSCLGKRNWDPKGKHCYVTGGSTGLGLALATLLSQEGAHVSIVARNVNNLKTALEQIQAARQSEDQIFHMYSYSLTSAEESEAALKAAMNAHGGRVPDASFLCAGGSRPKFFVEMSSEDLKYGIDMGYWVQAWSAWAISREMVKQRHKGRLVFVSSTLGYMTLPGYASYCPAKHATRGLADALRGELLLYDISVQIYMPATMFTPGYEEENKTKPKITAKLEEADGGLTPVQAATAMLKGVKNNQSHITSDFLTELFRVSTKGSTPGHFFLWDWSLGIIAAIGIPIWRMYVDRFVRSNQREHQEYLEERGFLREN